MNDPWRFIAFPVSAVSGFLIADAASSGFATAAGLQPFAADLVLVAVVGFIAGFMVDEVIPAYVEKVKNGRGGGSSFGGGGGGFDDSDLDFD